MTNKRETSFCSSWTWRHKIDLEMQLIVHLCYVGSLKMNLNKKHRKDLHYWSFYFNMNTSLQRNISFPIGCDDVKWFFGFYRIVCVSNQYLQDTCKTVIILAGNLHFGKQHDHLIQPFHTFHYNTWCIYNIMIATNISNPFSSIIKNYLAPSKTRYTDCVYYNIAHYNNKFVRISTARQN